MNIPSSKNTPDDVKMPSKSALKSELRDDRKFKKDDDSKEFDRR